VFPLIAGTYYWFPKVTGRMMSERLGKWNFWTLFIGFNVAFFPMHYLGLAGMPRRVYTYGAGLGWDTLNFVSTLGVLMIGVSVIMLIINLVRSRRHGEVAGTNPWDAPTLEWATTSPPPTYNFQHIPLVTSSNPLWDHREQLPVMRGLSVDKRELVLTTVLDAKPDIREPVAKPSIWPFISALAVGGMFIASIFTPWGIIFGSIPAAIAITIWFWPTGDPQPDDEDPEP
jgi:cytochrome c oxidase subunit I+III